MTPTMTTKASGPMRLLAGFYAAMAGLALYGQSDGLMMWLHVDRPLALGVGVAVELLAAVLFAFADWRRTHHGEYALAARVLSVTVAAGVAAMNFYSHPVSVGQRMLFTGASLAGYAVWVLHTNARRRDALRAAGRLGAQAPVYGLAQWLRAPRVTWRARLLAAIHPQMGVHESLDAAAEQMTTARRHAAIEKALRRKLSTSLDGVSADIAMVSYDLHQVAVRLSASVDYDALTGLLAADIAADRIAQGRKAKRPNPSDPAAQADGEADKSQPVARPPARRAKTKRPDAASRVRKALADHPNATQAEIARAAGTSDRTVRRVLSAARRDIDAIAGVAP